ncbi:MAG: hypothetical protein ACFCUJ_15630 [Thiotrichales bacterium]
MLAIKVVSTDAGFDDLQATWDRLAEAATASYFFILSLRAIRVEALS